MNRDTFIGVTYHKKRKRYQARARIAGDHYFIGDYKDPHDAAVAYDNARWFLQDFSSARVKLNFPDNIPTVPTPRSIQLRVRIAVHREPEWRHGTSFEPPDITEELRRYTAELDNGSADMAFAPPARLTPPRTDFSTPALSASEKLKIFIGCDLPPGFRERAFFGGQDSPVVSCFIEKARHLHAHGLPQHEISTILGDMVWATVKTFEALSKPCAPEQSS